MIRQGELEKLSPDGMMEWRRNSGGQRETRYGKITQGKGRNYGAVLGPKKKKNHENTARAGDPQQSITERD